MKGFTIWFTGLPSAGKSTLAEGLAELLRARGLPVEVLDGDRIRKALWPELGFSRADRDANVRRVATVAGMLASHGIITLVALVSPYAETRREQRARLGQFVEVFVDCPLEECARRDVKGLYAAQRERRLSGLTGVDDPYEPPATPEIHLRTDRQGVEACLSEIVAELEQSGRI